MVKFSKQFEAQLVPEWKDAFVDYWQLKKDLKKIHLLNINNNTPTHNSSLSNTLFTSIKKFSLFGHQHREHELIHVLLDHSLLIYPLLLLHIVQWWINVVVLTLAHQVHKKLASSASKGDFYETELFEQLADTDAAKEFFACLDLQLNKVNQFYQKKEKEFMERGESLRKQMDILIELKTAFKQQRAKGGASAQDSKEEASIPCTFSSGIYLYSQICIDFQSIQSKWARKCTSKWLSVSFCRMLFISCTFFSLGYASCQTSHVWFSYFSQVLYFDAYYQKF